MALPTAEINLALTPVTADWLYTMLGYGLLAAASKLFWLSLRGWHLMAKEEVPLVDFVAVFVPWAGLPIAAGYLAHIDLEWRPWAALSGFVWLIILLALIGRTAFGLRMRALGIDPVNCTRLGIDTRSMAITLFALTLICLILSLPLVMDQAAGDIAGHWALAGIALILLSGRLGPTLIVMGAAVTLGLLLNGSFVAVSPFALAASLFLILLLCARRWREPNVMMNID